MSIQNLSSEERRTLEAVVEAWGIEESALRSGVDTSFDDLPGEIYELKHALLSEKIEVALELAKNSVTIMVEGIRTIRQLAKYLKNVHDAF